ncbi:MAG: hypothetical protein M3Y82_03895 [Verrucomicrobiota bacterium]|nr:hypothetical protein [Verrucomicrobiota bacterium]
MKTKTLILTALLAVAGSATLSAQVFSVNAVGYVNVTLPPGFSMIANPLIAGTNTLGALIPVAPDGAQAYKFTGAGYVVNTFDSLAPGWLPAPNTPFNVGEGMFFRNNQATNLVITFVGEVAQGSLTNPLPAGFSIRSSMVPQSGAIDSILGLPAQDGDQIYKFTSSGYQVSTYDSLAPGWLPTAPVIQVGESFFLRETAAKDWVRNFSVNN